MELIIRAKCKIPIQSYPQELQNKQSKEWVQK
jgi:hypothetical protein